MKVVQPGFQMIQEPNLALKIERIARTCYKSEDKICEGSADKMIRNLAKKRHYAMLEHGSICVIVTSALYKVMKDAVSAMQEYIVPNEESEDKDVNPRSFLRFTKCRLSLDDNIGIRFVVSGNIRAWIDFFIFARSYKYHPIALTHNLLTTVWDACSVAFEEVRGMYDNIRLDEGEDVIRVTDYSVLTPEERMVHEDVSVLFTCDRGVTHELVRHRPASFAQESTRYCNYSLDKSDNQVTFIEPFFYCEHDREEEYNAWRSAMEDAEKYYLGLIERGSQPQEARSVLPHSTKVDIVVTTNLAEWKHIFELRACEMTGKAHPQMRQIMIPYFREMREQYKFAFGNMYLPEEVTP